MNFINLYWFFILYGYKLNDNQANLIRQYLINGGDYTTPTGETIDLNVEYGEDSNYNLISNKDTKDVFLGYKVSTTDSDYISDFCSTDFVTIDEVEEVVLIGLVEQYYRLFNTMPLESPKYCHYMSAF